MNTPDSYRGWRVDYDPKPIPLRHDDWTATHPNYDASWEGEEDGWRDNGLKASAATYEALCEEIDEIEDEGADSPCCQLGAAQVEGLAINLRAYAHSRGAPEREDDEEVALRAAQEIAEALHAMRWGMAKARKA